MVPTQSYARFNLYDIFANLLPGAVLLIGLFLPVLGVEGLLVELSIGSLIVLAVLSFAAGLAIQVLGSTFSSGSNDFAEHMHNVVEEKDESEENEIAVTQVDVQFLEQCRSEFGFSAEFEDWDRLFKLVLARLEETSRSRAIRLQALYLAMRGMVVSMTALSCYYLVSFLGASCDVFQTSVPSWSLLLLGIVCICLCLLFHSRQSEFSQDVTTYMINEYYLDSDTTK